MPEPRPLSLVDAELRSIRTIDDDARHQLDAIAKRISAGCTVPEWSELCDQRDEILLGIEARRGRSDELLDERLTISEKASA